MGKRDVQNAKSISLHKMYDVIVATMFYEVLRNIINKNKLLIHRLLIIKMKYYEYEYYYKCKDCTRTKTVS